MITSTTNQQMKNLTLLMKKAKARNEQGVFVAEGRKMFLEAPVEFPRVFMEHVRRAICRIAWNPARQNMGKKN